MENTINLKRFRRVMNLTQARAAESIGIDQRQWNRYENGRNEIPLHYVKELCVKHKISLDWLLELKYENENYKINIEEFTNELITEIEAMRDNGEINEELANYNLIPKIEDIASKYIEEGR